MKAKYNKFLKNRLKNMVIEIDITKTEKNFRQLLVLINKIEDELLINDKLSVNDIYFK